MKRLMLIAVLLILPLGCKKALEKATDTTPGKNEKAQIIPGGKGNLSVGAGDGIQGPRKAAARLKNDVQFDQLKTDIQNFRTADPDYRMPNAQELMHEIRQNNELVRLINDEVIILTNSQNPEGIVAYTQWPQRNNNHYVMTASGRIELSPAQLTEALKAQGSVVKLAK